MCGDSWCCWQVASRLTYRRLIKKLNNTKNPKERKKIIKQIKACLVAINGTAAVTLGSTAVGAASDIKYLGKVAKSKIADKKFEKKI